ncbi:hypothetical protein Anas_03251, partial [Armadillidium nasatum]
ILFRSSKFDKIVVLGNSSYRYYLEQLRGPKVCIMSDDISTDVLLSYIKCKEPLMPSRTLWVLVTGIEFLFSSCVNILCSSLRCNYPLQSTIPSIDVALYSNALTTIQEINNELNIIEQNVKRVLNFESDFMLFPPIPPAMIIDSSIAHQNTHNLIVKYPRCGIVTNIIASYFVDIFKKVSFSFADFTLSSLENMGISADPIKKYFDYELNQIDFVSSGTTLPLNKLPFFSEWSNAFRDIVSSCVGDSCYFEVSSKRESFLKSSLIFITSDDENDETDFESRVESVVERKSSIVKAADGVSSQIKGNTVVSNKAFATCSKPFSKGTFEKSGRDPKSTSSAKKVKQPTVKQKCSIYEIAADERPLPFLDSSESDAKPETLTALHEPDPKSEQDMESEIFDNFEEISEENLFSEVSNDSADNSNIDSSNLLSEISNDSADNSNIDSSEDAKELSSKSVKEHLNKNPSNDSTFHITTQIVSRNLKEKTQNINTQLISENCSREGELFSGKVLTNIPDNKEPYNDEVKRQNLFDDRCQEKDKNENMNVTSSFVEVIQSDINHLNNSVVLGKNLEFSSNILPLEESSEEDMYKSSKIEENSDNSYIQEQLLIEEELDAEIFGDDECSYDDDDGNDDGDKARDVLEDDIENSSKRLYSPSAAEPDRENIPTSNHAYYSLSKEEKLHSNNSDIQIESFLNNVKEVSLEINNVSKEKEDLESCESTSVLENDTKISVSESKSDNITKETLNITVGHISERNISSGSIPEDKDFASNDSSQALAHITLDNDLKMDESFRKSEDSEDIHKVKMDSFDYDLLNKESDIIFDLEKASDSQSSNERFGKSEEKTISNNEQDIENKVDLQDSLSNKIELNARLDIKSQSQNVSEIAFENLDTYNQVPKFSLCTDKFDETVIRLDKLENFDSKIEVQDLCDEGKANQIEDVGVAKKAFKKEGTSEDKPNISEGSKKITEKSNEESKLKFVSGEETTEKI